MQLTSNAFANGQPVPKKHTGDGQDVSPALNWSDMPAGTKELALIVDDPDAPSPEPWVHWVAWQIPATMTGLPEGVPPAGKAGVLGGAVQGKNSWGAVGYRGPAPPKGHGVHHYHFKLYALDAAVKGASGGGKTELLKAIEGHVLGTAELVGTYQRG